jgi:small-conductance mechanosensitive channel
MGDFLIVGELRGTVEKIGLKTTRIRSLSGEQLIFSLSDLLKSRVRTFQRMNERRARISFAYPTRTLHVANAGRWARPAPRSGVGISR